MCQVMVIKKFKESTECGVCGLEFECWPRNHSVLWESALGLIIGPHIQHKHWCSSQEAESREINICCTKLFLNQCKLNMLKVRKAWIGALAT